MINIVDFLLNPLNDFYTTKYSSYAFFGDDDIKNKYNIILIERNNFMNSNILDVPGFKEDLFSEKDINLFLNKYFPEFKDSHEYVHDLILSKFSGNKRNPKGLKLIQCLLRVASTRIFSDPEQSIMELPVNSIDSYKSLHTSKDYDNIGRFGMGFFSFLYWISNHKRKIIIDSTYMKNNTTYSYECELIWTENGLKYNIKNKKAKAKTGTTITLFCDDDPLLDENIIKINEYLDKLYFIEKIPILLNGEIINNANYSTYKKTNKVNIILNKYKISVSDTAKGIPEDILFNVLLIPTVSTKKRIAGHVNYYKANVLKTDLNYKLNIVISGVKIKTITMQSNTNEAESYQIFLPSSSKLPVARDDVIFEKNSIEIEKFEESISQILSILLNTTKNIYYFIELLKKYSEENKSVFLENCINKKIREISSEDMIFVPYTNFWLEFIKLPMLKKKYVLFDHSLIYNAELKFEEELKTFTHSSNVFKSRIVVYVNDKLASLSDESGFQSYIFISKKTKIDKYSLLRSDTLLIPKDYKMNKECKIYTESESTQNSIDILYYCLYKKTKQTFREDHFEKFILTCLDILPLPKKLFTLLASKIGNCKIKSIYGETFYTKMVKIFTPENWEDVNKTFENNNTNKICKKLLEYYVDIFPKTQFGHFRIPDIEDFVFDEINNKIEKELELFLQGNPSKTELFILNQILKRIQFSNKSLSSYDKIKGLFNYILSEQRRIISSREIHDILCAYYETQKESLFILLMDNLIVRLYNSSINYLNILNKNMSLFEEEVDENPEIFFTCKFLIEYYLSNNEQTLDYHKLDSVYLSVKELKRDLLDMQILEIAVNEGTTKPYIPAVITELIQNSLDATKSLNYENDIEIEIGFNFLSVKDYAGMDKIEEILIPFLSSKDPNDPDSVGEMGTGFFNCYRQPYTKYVKIETVKNGIKHTILAKPILEDNIVVDICYSINITKSKGSYTKIYVVFNDDINIYSSLSIEAELFCKNNLSFISSSNIYLNGKKLNNKYEKVYEEEGIGSIFIDPYQKSISRIYTNEVPFESLDKIIKNEHINTNIHINFEKESYVPVQSRNVLKFKDQNKISDFLEIGLILAVFSKYINDMLDNPDDIIDHSTSKSSIYQLIPYPNKNKYSTYKFSGSYLDRYGMSVAETISYVINLFNMKKMLDIEDLPRKTLYEKVIYKWFDGKKTSQEKEPVYSDSDFDESDYKKESNSCQELNIFTKLYFGILSKCMNEIKGLKHLNLFPDVNFAELKDDLLGYFSDDSIVLNSKIYSKTNLQNRLKRKIESDLDFEFDPILSKYFSPEIPSCTFIHELTHAILNTNHEDYSSHGTTNIRIIDPSTDSIETTGKKERHLDFEEAAIYIYRKCIDKGLLDLYIKEIEKFNQSTK